MKLDTNTLLVIGGGLLAYYLYKNNRGMIAGGNCGSTYGPQGLEFEGKCQKCPEIVTQNGIVAPTPFQNECMLKGRSRGNLDGFVLGEGGGAKKPINRKSSRDRKIEQVGSWKPNDTSCTPCTTMQYQGNRTTARIHKSWCDLNCAVEVAQANKLRNPFGNLFNPKKN
tara:strand:+ start:1894 stop:2397 length:504 start_codon:yes stop_codon:yes gene_type:complete